MTDAELHSQSAIESAERFRNLVENAFDIIVECATSGRILYVSPNIREVLGYEPDEVIGTFINDLVHPDDVRTGVDSFAGAVLRGEKIYASLRYRRKSGEWRTIEGRGNAYRNAADKMRVVIIGRDITDRVNAESELRRSTRRIALLREQTPVAVIVWDMHDCITEWNPAAEQIFGYRKDEIIGKSATLLIPPTIDDSGLLISEVRKALAQSQKPIRMSAENVKKSGERVTCEWTLAPLLDDAHAMTGVLTIAQDLSERQRARRLEDLAYHDAVTGMPNRRLFDDRLVAYLDSHRRRGDTFALLYADVDNFKGVNDRHGHDVGDKVLAALSLRLRVCVRDSDVVARLGGDEFGILLTKLEGPGYAEEVATRIIESIAKPLNAGIMTFNMSVSVGISTFPGDGATSTALLRKADEAMYRAKARGKSTFSS